MESEAQLDLQNMSRRRFLELMGSGLLAAMISLSKPSLVKAAELKEEETGQLAPVVVRGNPDKRQVAITIDDGWNPKEVERFLEISDNLKFKATLFPVGRVMGPSSSLWKEAVDRGHEIGCHTYSHAWLTKLSDKQVREEVEEWEEVADKIGIPETKWIRPPFMAGFAGRWDTRLRRIFGKLGLAVALWSIDSGSTQKYPNITAREIAEGVIRHIHPGAIILFHFIPPDIEALPPIVEEVRRQRYELVTLSQMFPDILKPQKPETARERRSPHTRITRRDFLRMFSPRIT